MTNRDANGMDSQTEPTPQTPTFAVDEQKNNDRTPQPTDSMVTVPLSGCRTSFGEDAADRRASTCSGEWFSRERRESVDDSICRRHSVAPSTRASSRGSRSSQGSQGSKQDLDWGELEKSEEMESKADPDDEVSVAIYPKR